MIRWVDRLFFGRDVFFCRKIIFTFSMNSDAVWFTSSTSHSRGNQVDGLPRAASSDKVSSLCIVMVRRTRWTKVVRSTLLHLCVRGSLRALLGVLLRLFVFVFEPMFVASKRDQETKASESQGFQTMRNPMVITIFFHLHGTLFPETNFGVIFGTFLT